MSSDDDVETRVGPPAGILGAAALQVLAQVALFAPGVPLWHWAGYLVGSVTVPVTVFVFRSVDRTRRRSGLYAAPGGMTAVPVVLLACGLALALVHADYLAIHKQLA